MGIPSYYRKLVRSCPRLVRRSDTMENETIQWFFMDYNCLIYHCLHRPGAPVYPLEAETDSSVKATWEMEFIQHVVEYTVSVIRQVGAEQGVYIAIDGVVPMAKMRQQRLRRFKSAWLSARGYGRDGKGPDKEADEKEPGARWDTNAITPGTVFMDALYDALMKRIVVEGKTGIWRISSCREWGEGEHKIMAEWRRGGYGGKGAVAVYGLDADLIVLSLLGRELYGLTDGVWLFREVVEKGCTQYDLFDKEQYEWLSVDELRRWLVAPYAGALVEQSFVIQYAFMMSFLGNDFLPSSLSYKMRDDGHSVLLDLLRQFFAANCHLVGSVEEGCPILLDGLVAFFRELAREEAGRTASAIMKKKRMAEVVNALEGKAIGDIDWPLAVMEEDVLLDHGRLARDWQHRYITHFFHGFSDHPSSRDALCRQYLYGVQWVWGYYLGRMEDVCFGWWYPFSLPPLWEWLSETKELPAFSGTVQVKGPEIDPTEQLSLVLPLESWSLLPPCPQRKLPYRAPHLFPTEFSFDSVGKRFFWECESMIPIPTIQEVKCWCM